MTLIYPTFPELLHAVNTRQMNLRAEHDANNLEAIAQAQGENE